MYILLLLSLTVQQWTAPSRVSPDTIPGTHPAICSRSGWAWEEICVCWYSSNHLWTRFWTSDSWLEPALVDTTQCTMPSVTTSSMCKGPNEFVWVAWTDLNGYIRLSFHGSWPPWEWSTTARDSGIKGHNPAITSDSSGKIWCVWTGLDTSHAEHYYLTSCHDGKEWAAPVLLKEFAPVRITHTAGITADYEDNIWVSYNDHELIYVQYWNGNSWSAPESVGTCFDYAYPTMCADSAAIWTAWLNSIEWRILCRYYNGMQWSEVIEFPIVSYMAAFHLLHQDICLDACGRLWAGWWEETPADVLHYFIVAGFWSSRVWEDTAVVDYYWGARGGYPSVVCGDDDKVWLVWQSEKEGDWNIYASYTEVTAVEEKIPTWIPRDFALLQNRPNPFNTFTSIRYVLPSDSYVELTIHNIQGDLIRKLVGGWKPTGSHSVYWDGEDERGRNVSSGIHFYRLKAGGIEHTRKMIILK